MISNIKQAAKLHGKIGNSRNYKTCESAKKKHVAFVLHTTPKQQQN